MISHCLRTIRPTRRAALAAGGTALASLVAGPEFSRAAECILTSRQVDGPYYITGTEDRRDVRSGKPGVSLALRMRVVDAGSCEAIAGARTEIWSCDALGTYSGHPDVDPNVPPRFGGGGAPGSGGGPGATGADRTDGPRGGSRSPRLGGHRVPTGAGRFLRGSQASSEQGEVEFLTIYPGWYAPRAVHVHVKVHLGANELLTTQLYFPDDLTSTIHRTEAYVSRHPTPYRNSNDRVKYWGLGGSGPVGVFPTMTTEGDLQVGTLTIGVRRA